jgi:hypothetical protein
MKICVLISSHSPSVYTKLTVATLLRACEDNNQLNIHVGIHSNYGDYTDDRSLFSELEGLTQIHCVDEIDWAAHARDNYRYSVMHSKNLENLMKNVRYYDFDYIAILDNDLYIKADFISLLTKGSTDNDLIFCYHNRNVNTITNERRPTGEYTATVEFAPKIACWNLMISKKLFERIMENPSIIYPERVTDESAIQYYKSFIPEFSGEFPIVFDTLSKVLFHSIHTWSDMKCLEIDSTQMSEDLIKHFFCSSFNYGLGIINNQVGESNAANIYNYEFPRELEIFKRQSF